MTRVEELKEEVLGGYENEDERLGGFLNLLIAAAKQEERERILGKTQEVHFSDGVNGWTGMLTTELPKFPKTEEGKFYLNTDHIKIIPTEEPRAG